MNLVPDNIDESIKHLTPRSSEEIEKFYRNYIKKIKKMPDVDDVYLAWQDSVFKSAEEKICYKELEKRNALHKVQWYYNLTPRSLTEIISQIKDLKLDDKIDYLRDMQRHYPSIFKDFKEDKNLDDETNQLLLFMQLKAVLDGGDTEEVNRLITVLAKKYGRTSIIDKVENLYFFTKTELAQLKLSIYNKSQTKEEKEREDNFDTYAFIGYQEDKEITIKGKKYYEKELGIENLVKIDKYNVKSIQQISAMKIRSHVQYAGSYGGGDVWVVYIPKEWLGEDSYTKRDIPDYVLDWIKEHKFKV